MIKRLSGGAVALMVLLAPAIANAGPMFPTVLSGNTTGHADAYFVGPPDDSFVGLGADDVTYDFGPFLVVNRPGLPDLNVYEVDWGAVESGSMDILVSEDGIAFTSIWASGIALIDANRIPGDSTHGNNLFGQSYDLGGFSSIRYVRIDGTASGRAGGTNAFDLDAIGAHEVVREGGPAPAVPEPASSVLVATGLAAIARHIRRRR